MEFSLQLIAEGLRSRSALVDGREADSSAAGRRQGPAPPPAQSRASSARWTVALAVLSAASKRWRRPLSAPLPLGLESLDYGNLDT